MNARPESALSAFRDEAVRIVDGNCGHAVEFCHSPDVHRRAYDDMEDALRAEAEHARSFRAVPTVVR